MAKMRLWLASQSGRCREVEALSTEIFLQETLQAALMVAVANDHAGVVCILLRAGADCVTTFGFLHAALRHDSAAALRRLIEARVYVSSRGNAADAASYGAADAASYGAADAVSFGATRCLQVLLLAKADLTSRCMNGKRPISAAAARGCVDSVHLLVQAKADIDAKDYGDTPVFVAAQFGHVHAVHQLLLAKADATRCNNYTNESPLLIAAVEGYTAVVRCLLAHVPALAAVATRQVSYARHAIIPAGSTPLDVAVQFKHSDVISLLLAATVNKKI